jgi:hypothetical protein
LLIVVHLPRAIIGTPIMLKARYLNETRVDLIINVQ